MGLGGISAAAGSRLESRWSHLVLSYISRVLNPLSLGTLRLALIGALFALGGCASESSVSEGSGVEWVSHPRTERVTHLVLHHTAASTEVSLRVLTGHDPGHRVSAHYLVTDEPVPRVLLLIPENRVAYHAGKSAWRGREGLNACSIGIEIVNADGDRQDYPPAQVEAVAKLVAELAVRHGIEARNIVAHAEIAPDRKSDPGRRFPWERLYREHGLGCWPSPALLALLEQESPPSPETLATMLREWGYRVDDTDRFAQDASVRLALLAFQRRYRPEKVDGLADAETVARLRALLAARP